MASILGPMIAPNQTYKVHNFRTPKPGDELGKFIPPQISLLFAINSKILAIDQIL